MLWGQNRLIKTGMTEERQWLVLEQQKRCDELQLVFHDPDGPYLGVVDETVPQAMPEFSRKTRCQRK